VDASRPLGGDDDRDGRGVAIADLDGDGRVDVVINNNNATPTIYLNRVRRSGNSLRLTLRGNPANGSPRDPIGARVRVSFRPEAGRPSKTLTRWLEAGSGYAAQSEMAVHFGLGKAASVESVEITWPSGHVDRLPGEDLSLGRRVRLVESDRRVAAFDALEGAASGAVVHQRASGSGT